MKKLVYMFLLVGSLLMGANVVNAAGDGAKKHKAKMKYVSCSDQTTQIKDLIGSPDINKTATVEVNFNINEFNVITVNSVKSENKDLEKLVYQRLNGKSIRGNETEMKDQALTLVFKTETAKIYTIY